jgi:hypothetical protein
MHAYKEVSPRDKRDIVSLKVNYIHCILNHNNVKWSIVYMVEICVDVLVSYIDCCNECCL